MQMSIRKIIIVCLIAILMAFVYFVILFNWVILPTESLSNRLMLVQYGYVTPSQITLRHYIDDVHICDYRLDLKIELRHQTVQTYEFPQIDKGRIELCVELKNNKGCITTSIDKANDLYERGLLIYSNSDFSDMERYVYFISGENQMCYHNKNGTSEWILTTDAPEPKKITKQEISYSPHYYGWKENKWIKITTQ